MSRRPRTDLLPPFAVEYLASAPKEARHIVQCFHSWLKGTHRPVLQLEPCEVEQFLSSLRTTVAQATRSKHRGLALRYLHWLHEHQLLPFDPTCAWPRSGPQLPEQALRFLRALAPTHQLSTLRQHQTNLRHFHVWLDTQAVGLDAVDRSHISSWLQWIHARGRAASTRVHAIQMVRTYFRWLEDQPDYLGKPANELIRPSDLPKLPQYLPRPIPPELDAELQRRFRKSRSLHQLGLLLMRRTGLRIGELRSLAYDCVRTDLKGNTLLKVPLGKLATERLVPVDERTAKLLRKLRRLGGRGRRELLLETPTGKKTRYHDYTCALRRASRGFTLAEPITTHRLRHTYATAMLAGGMSLPALMKLLGHRDYRMTLRYAAISDETVVTEYAEAVRRNEQRYKTQLPAEATAKPLPAKALTDLARFIQKRVEDDGLDKTRARALIKRLFRLDTAVRRLFRTRNG